MIQHKLNSFHVKCNGSLSPVEGLWVCGLIQQPQGVSTTKRVGGDPCFGELSKHFRVLSELLLNPPGVVYHCGSGRKHMLQVTVGCLRRS